MALFKIEKGLASNLNKYRPNTTEGYCYFTTDDGKFYIDIASGASLTNRVLLNAGKADALTTSAGSNVIPVYFKDGKPVACEFSYNDITGEFTSIHDKFKKYLPLAGGDMDDGATIKLSA